MYFSGLVLSGFVSAVVSINSFTQDTTDSKYSKQYTFDRVSIQIKEVDKQVVANNHSPEMLNHYSIKIFDRNLVISKDEILSNDRIAESWISDLDQDKNFEIVIHTIALGSGSYGTLYFYEYNNGELVRFTLPELNTSLNNFYRGHDKFSVTKRSIEREFPVYDEADANCCPTGGKVRIEYEFANNKMQEGSFSRQKPESDTESANREFLMTIKSVSDLPNMDGFSASDCWLQIFLGERLLGETPMVRDNNFPQFNTQFEVFKYSGEVIRIKAFDRDVSKDEIIGETVVAKPESGVFPISYEASDGSIKKRGTIEILFEK